MTNKELSEMLVSWENLPALMLEIETHPGNLEMLMDLAFNGKDPKTWRAAYLADQINDSRPELIEPFIPEMIRALKTETNYSKKRHFLKLISFHKFSPKHHVFLTEFCLGCFASAHEPVSNRVHAAQILFNISEKEPDFKPELLSVIEYEMELHPTPGIISRGKKLAKKLAEQIKDAGK